jgi:hypothetical protein
MVLLAVAVVLAAGYFIVLLQLLGHAPHTPSTPRASPTPGKPACPTARLPDAAQLGDVAWISAGSLMVIDLENCRQTVVVAKGAAPPVRFSPDGRWLAFGDGRVVASTGGSVLQPFGSAVKSWAWSPTADDLAGVTDAGGVLIAGLQGAQNPLLPDGSGVGHLAFSPDGRSLAVDRAKRGIQVLEVATGKARTVFPQPDPASVPEVAGWSPDGHWVLYWRGPVSKDGGPLDAVPSTGGPWVNVFEPVLPYRDFVSPCGSEIALSAGPGVDVTLGKQIVFNGPPNWAFRGLTDDFSRSWFWPSCSPDGRWVAATDSFNQPEPPNHTIPRALWLLASDGSSRRILVPGFHGAPEYPRWSSDGTVILVVRRMGNKWSSPGNLLLVQVNPASGRLVKVVGPLADVGAAPGPGGHQQWSAISDWYRPQR